MRLQSLAGSLVAVGLLTLPLASQAGGHFGGGFHGGFSGHSSSSAVVHGFSSGRAFGRAYTGQGHGNWGHGDWRHHGYYWHNNWYWYPGFTGIGIYDFGYPYDYGDSYNYPQPYYDDYGQYGVAADVQAALARRGYYRGMIDGVIGPQSRHAIEAFQADQGLPVTGQIDAGLLRALRIT